MAVSQSQIVDLLYKQAFGVTKTDTATNKSPSNESIPSPLLIRGDTEWTQADQIPGIAAAVSGVVQAYTGANAVQCVADNTTVPVGGIYPTWKTNLTYWIPSEFGSTYSVQVWVDNSGVANPTSTGTQIFADGSGGNGQFYYNYQSGVLNFIGETIPSVLTAGKVLYIVGYRYIGLTGVTNLPSDTNIGNLNFSGTTIISTNTDGNIIFTPNGNGIVQVSSALTSNANITANFFIGNGSQLTGVAASNAVSAGTVTASAQPNITSVGTLISLDVAGNITAGNINGGNLVSANFFSGDGYLLSNLTGANVIGNVTSAVTANFANYAGNVTVNSQPNITSVGTLVSLAVTGNISAGNISTTGAGGNITGANVVSANTFSGNLLATTANINGNLISLNANLGNLASANFFSGDGGYLTNVAAGNAVTAGTVTSNAQPNITSVGTLTSLTVSGNANVGGILTDNYYYANGTPVDFQQTGGSNTQIQFNNDGNFGGNNNFTFDSVTGNVTIPNNLNLADGGGIYNYAVGQITLSPNIANDITGLNLQDGAGAYLYADTEVVISSNTVGTVHDWTFDDTGNLTAPAAGTINAGNLLTANYVTGTLTTNAQPNITSVGTLTSLGITGNISSVNYVFANYFSGDGGQLSNITAGNITGQVANALVASTVYTNAQPNITSVGTLTSLTVSGNATVGNLVTSGSGGTVSNVNLVSANTFVASGNITANNLIATSTGSFSGNVNMNNQWINNVGYPNLNADVATKLYVDTMVASGISYHQAVLAATTTTLAIATSGTTAYVQPNGSGNGIGAYISTTGAFNLIDTANVQTIGTRILVKNESNAAWNGVYTYANTTAIIRATDADEYGPDSSEQLSVNDFFFTTGGNVNQGTGFVVSAPTGTITFGTSNIEFAIFSTAPVYDAGTGLTLIDTTFSISNTTVTSGSYGNGDTVATFTVNPQGQLTAASNAVITANAANLTGTTLASSIVTTSITSTGTLISLNVSGNANVGNLGTGGLIVATGNITGGNLTTGGQVVATGNGSFGNISTTGSGGNISGANNVSANTFTGTLTTNAQPNITSVGTLTSLGVSGVSNLGPIGNVIITGGSSGYYLQTNGSGNLTWVAIPTATGIANGNSNVNIPSANGNITMSVAGNANVIVVTGTGANIAGDTNITGNLVAGAGVGGNITGANLVSANYFTGTLTTAAQPNITSVGSLTSLTVSGTSNLGPVGNVTITGGSSGYYLQTNGSGTLSWEAIPTGTGIANGNSNVSIPSANGNVNISAVGNANILVVTGTGANITGTANVSGNLTVGNISGANLISANYFTGTLTTNAQPNITSVGILGNLDISGHLVANTFQMGYGVYEFYSTSVFFATTSSTSIDQLLWNYPAADLSAIDFTIIATDSVGGTRQTCKISAAILGTTVAFNEYGGLYINGGVGSFSVVYNGSGPTPMLELVVTPDSSNLTEYNMLISKYLV